MPVDVSDVFRVQVAWATDPWDTSPTWTDLTDITASERALRGSFQCTITKGRQGGNGSVFVPATMTVQFRNNDADFDAQNTSSTFGYLNLLRNKRVRALVSDDSFTGSNNLFDGYISDIIVTGDGLESVATVTARDLLGLLAEYDVASLTRDAVEWTGDRVTAILDAAGVPAGLRGTIDNGTQLMPAGELNGQALDLLNECARAEYGYLYAEDGTLQFRERYAIRDVTAWSTVAHEWADSGSVGAGDSTVLHVGGVGRTLGGFRDVSRVTSSKADGNATYTYDETATDFPPITPADGPYSLVVAFEAHAETAAELWFEGWETSQRERVEGLQARIYPGSSNELTAVEAGYYDPLTRCQVITTPKGFGSAWTFSARVEQCTHEITAQEWVATLVLSPTTTFDASAGFDYEYGDTLTAFNTFGK